MTVFKLKKVAKPLLVLSMLIFFSYKASAQDMYRNLMREHNKYRIGIGIQVSEPTALVFNLFKGEMCSNSNAFETSLIWEAFLGYENMVLNNNKTFLEGQWQSGGLQGGLNALFSAYALESRNFSFQLIPGLGIQYGNRNYDLQGETFKDKTLGLNFMVRGQITGHGISISNNLFFISYFLELKYYRQLSFDFSYTKPGFGVIIRKVR